MKKILFLLTQDLASPSGLGRYFPIAKYLVEQGYQAEIGALHSDYENLPVRDVVVEGVNVHYVSQMHVRKVHNQTQYFSNNALIKIAHQAAWRLLGLVVRSKPDLILIGKPHPMNSFAGLVGGWLIRKPVIVDCDDYEAASNRFSFQWQYKIVRHFENSVPKSARHVTTNTYFNLERMAALGIPRTKISYLPNGVDQDRFENLDPEKLAQLREHLTLSGFKVVAYIGSLSLANHPVDLLLESFRRIAASNGQVKLLIVGGGADLDNLKAQAVALGIDERVVFCGRVDSDQVPYYYQLADVTVDPVNETEAAKGRCPLKMFESWMAGVPFVTADVGDRRILAGEPTAALLAVPGDSQNLAEKINSILNDDRLKAKLQSTGFEQVKEYTWKAIVTRNLAVFS